VSRPSIDEGHVIASLRAQVARDATEQRKRPPADPKSVHHE
jgi:hypothetical protein